MAQDSFRVEKSIVIQDENGNEITQITGGTVDPTVSPSDNLPGTQYTNTTNGKTFQWDGNSWNEIVDSENIDEMIEGIGGTSPTIEYHLLYVDKNGKDTNNGSQTHPFLTIQKAVNQIATNADNDYNNAYMIDIGEGFFEENVVLNNSTFTNITFSGKGINRTWIRPNTGNSITCTTNNDQFKILGFKDLSFNTKVHIEGEHTQTAILDTWLEFHNVLFGSTSEIYLYNITRAYFTGKCLVMCPFTIKNIQDCNITDYFILFTSDVSLIADGNLKYPAGGTEFKWSLRQIQIWLTVPLVIQNGVTQILEFFNTIYGSNVEEVYIVPENCTITLINSTMLATVHNYGSITCLNGYVLAGITDFDSGTHMYTNPATQHLYENEALSPAQTVADALDLLLEKTILNPILPTENYAFYVSKGGNDTTGNGTRNKPYLTIQRAITDINTLFSPIGDYAYTILVGAGTFVETSTLIIPVNTTLQALSDFSAMISVNPYASPHYTLVKMQDMKTYLTGFYLYGFTDSTIISITAPALASVNDCVLLQGSIGIDINVPSMSQIFLRGISIISSVIIGIYAHNKSQVYGSSIVYTTDKTNTTFCLVDGVDSFLMISSFNCSNANICLHVTDHAIGWLFGGEISNTITGCKVETYGDGTLESTDMWNAITYACDQADIYSKIAFYDSYHDVDTMKVLNWNLVEGHYTNIKYQDEGQHFLRDLQIGVPEVGHRSYFGEGQAYTRNILVYTYNATTLAYANVTNNIKNLETGNTSPILTTTFPNNATNNAIYISNNLQTNGDYLKFYGMSCVKTIAAVKGTGNFVFEYWNGSTWVAFDTMSFKWSNYTTFGNAAFTFIEDGGINFDSIFITSWQKNDPISSGINRYWIRVRITAPLTTLPIFEQIKLFPSRIRFGEDGFQIYTGKARQRKFMPYEVNSADGANNAPSNVDIYRGRIGVGRRQNGFSGSLLKEIGFCTLVPLDMDTSCPMEVTIYYVGEVSNPNSSSNKVEWEVRYDLSNDGMLLLNSEGSATTTEITTTIIDTLPTNYTAWTQREVTLNIRIPAAISNPETGTPNMLWIEIARDATSGNSTDDTYGQVNIVQIFFKYRAWNNGGHLL